MSELVKVETSALTDEALNWAVAVAEGLSPSMAPPCYGNPYLVLVESERVNREKHRYAPTSKWKQAGVLINKYQISLHCPQHDNDCWASWLYEGGKGEVMGGSTPLEALCRVIVRVKLGQAVEVPRELLL